MAFFSGQLTTLLLENFKRTEIYAFKAEDHFCFWADFYDVVTTDPIAISEKSSHIQREKTAKGKKSTHILACFM